MTITSERPASVIPVIFCAMSRPLYAAIKLLRYLGKYDVQTGSVNYQAVDKLKDGTVGLKELYASYSRSSGTLTSIDSTRPYFKVIVSIREFLVVIDDYQKMIDSINRLLISNNIARQDSLLLRIECPQASAGFFMYISANDAVPPVISEDDYTFGFTAADLSAFYSIIQNSRTAYL